MTEECTNRRLRRRQQLLAAAIFAGLVVTAVGTILVTEEPRRERRPSEETRFSIRPDHADRETFLARYDARILELTREVTRLREETRERENALRAELLEQEKRLSGQTKSLDEVRRSAAGLGVLPKPGETPEETRARLAAFEEKLDQARYVASLQSHFGSEVPGPVYTSREGDQSLGFDRPLPETADLPGLAEAADALEPHPQDTRAAPRDAAGRPLKRLSLVEVPPATREQTAGAAGESRARPALARDEAVAINRVPGSSVSDYLPAGSFVSGRILTGLYASTGAGASSQALPMLIRLEKAAVLPNRWHTDIESCHLTASATGDLSSERVFVRLDRLACIGKTGTMLDVRVKGYAVGADGKVGLRGKLVTRSGQAIASAISVGLLSGIGNAVTRSNEEVTTSITGTQTKRYTNAWVSGLGEGMADAMDRITDYYLRLADRIFPVLEVEAGRPVDIVFSQGVLFKDGVD